MSGIGLLGTRSCPYTGGGPPFRNFSASDLRRAISLAPLISPKISFEESYSQRSCLLLPYSSPQYIIIGEQLTALLLFSNEKDCNSGSSCCSEIDDIPYSDSKVPSFHCHHVEILWES
jgi:hypothetical protein